MTFLLPITTASSSSSREPSDSLACSSNLLCDPDVFLSVEANIADEACLLPSAALYVRRLDEDVRDAVYGLISSSSLSSGLFRSVKNDKHYGFAITY